MVTPCIVKSSLYCSGVNTVLIWARQLKAQNQRLQPAQGQKTESRDDVANADFLMIDRREPADQPRLGGP